MTTQTPNTDIRSTVREHYGQIAQNFEPKQRAACCGSSASTSCNESDAATISVDLPIYETPDAATLPEEVAGLSLGCGDPIALAQLQPGQTVLDLGSGGGIDCFLAAKRVGPTGQVIGVDMTPAMLEKARANQVKMNASNVDFRLGEIEHLPVADQSVDVIISNCVINLSPDKPQVFREAFRALKPGGKLAVSDIVTDGPLPEVIKSSLSAWAGCVAGALDVKDYIAAIEAAGFTNVALTPVYWDQETIDAAVSQLDPEAAQQVATAKQEGKAVLIVNDGGKGEVIGVDANQFGNFDPRKSVFSAKITAQKP
jgi:SAM-dependent methyltransferase